MENEKKGVFSPCAKMDSTSMIKCLLALLFNYPSIKINSVSTEEKYKGFKVFFTDPQDSVVLKKNPLLSEKSEEQPIWIYPLTTYLIILNVHDKKIPRFEQDLHDAINKKFGRVKAVLKTKYSHQREEHWRIEIDIPEFKCLEAFETNFSEIILRIGNEEVALKFWCRKCEESGHFQHECPTKDGEQNNRRSESTVEENNSNDRQFGENSGLTTGRNSEQADPVDAIRGIFDLVNKFGQSTLEDGDYGTECADNSFANKSPSNASNSSITDGGRNFEESRSSERSAIFPSFTSPATAGLSHEFSSTAVKTPRSDEDEGRSELLEASINEACTSSGILSRDSLDKFFRDVRNKSNLIYFASKYTTDSEGLTKQLEHIVDLYYNNMKERNKHDENDQKFIAWLENLVQRYKRARYKKKKSQN